MNDVLLTAFYRSLFEVLNTPQEKPLPVTMTIDLRRYIPSGRAETICNLTGVFFPTLVRTPGDTFEDTLVRVHGLTQTAKRHHPWLGGTLCLELAFLSGYAVLNHLMRLAEKHHLIADNLHPFTNIGVVHPERMNFGETEVTDFYSFGPVSHPPLIVLGMTTFRKTLTVTLSYCNTATDEKIIHQFLDQFVGELPA